MKLYHPLKSKKFCLFILLCFALFFSHTCTPTPSWWGRFESYSWGNSNNKKSWIKNKKSESGDIQNLVRSEQKLHERGHAEILNAKALIHMCCSCKPEGTHIADGNSFCFTSCWEFRFPKSKLLTPWLQHSSTSCTHLLTCVSQGS